MKTYGTVSRSDVAFAPFEIKEVESATQTLLEASSWMDWWMYVALSIILKDVMTWLIIIVSVYWGPKSNDSGFYLLLAVGSTVVLLSKVQSSLSAVLLWSLGIFLS